MVFDILGKTFSDMDIGQKRKKGNKTRPCWRGNGSQEKRTFITKFLEITF